jgi:FG-GAP repeat
MGLRHQTYQFVSAVILVCGLLPTATRAQFFQQGPKLVGSGAVGPTVQQGVSVSLSGDGNSTIVGGRLDQSSAGGAVWVFTRSRGVWSQQGPKLVGTGAIGFASQGSSVSLSADGNTTIVGGPTDNFPIPGGQGPAGAAWVFTRSRGVWSQQGPKLVGTGVLGFYAEQGSSVALSADGNTAIVGGPADETSIGAGAAWIYTRSGGLWTQQAKLVGAGAVGGASQGASVSLSADGNTAILGGFWDNRVTPGGNFSIGAAWVFTRSGGTWTQQAKLVGTGAIGYAGQGYSVSLSADGNTAIVGGPFDDNGGIAFGGTGAAWVFTRLDGVWTQQTKLVGTEAVGPANQGISVSLSGDGDTAIVGARTDNSAGFEVGATWVFTRSHGVWSQLGGKLVGTGTIGRAWQGNSVSIASDGNTAMVGGPRDNNDFGAAWVFSRQPMFAGTPGKANCFGQSVSVLARQYGGLNNAAVALGFDSVGALQDAIQEFCEG